MTTVTTATATPPAAAVQQLPAPDVRVTLADRLTSAAFGLTWALWLGGVVALFLFVTAAFRVAFPDDRPNAVRAAQAAFIRFGRYQLALAAIALLLSIAWRLQRPRATRTATIVLTALSASLAGVIYWITLKIIALSQAGETTTPLFRQLHGGSMTAYLAIAVLLLAIGAALHRDLTSPNRKQF